MKYEYNAPNTIQQQERLVNLGLATKKIHNDLVTYKYAKKVMYDYLWDTDETLLECRGHTYDLSTGLIVLTPPRKSFNYLENGNWKDVGFDTPVVAFKKFNGFMASATMYKDELIVGTTGTTNPNTSEYVGWATREIIKSGISVHEDITRIFEIIIPEDPHIVEEPVQGAVLLLSRWGDGFTQAHRQRDSIENSFVEGTLSYLLELSKVDKGEGWMVYKEEDILKGNFNNPCKLKTEYYVQKKKLMRAGKNSVQEMFNEPRKFASKFNPTFAKVIDSVVNYHLMGEWLSMTDVQRRKFIDYVYEE